MSTEEGLEAPVAQSQFTVLHPRTVLSCLEMGLDSTSMLYLLLFSEEMLFDRTFIFYFEECSL